MVTGSFAKAYIDATVIPVATVRKDDYIAFARKVDPLFREVGALSVVDAWGSDVPDGKRMIFGGFEVVVEV